MYFMENIMDLGEIGAMIRNRRLARNLSQASVSDQVRISRPNLSQLENGKLPEIGIRKVIEVLEQLGLELTVREAHARPTLRELAAERSSALSAPGEATVRKRARRRAVQAPATGKAQS